MKKLLFLALLGLVFSPVFSQEQTANTDATNLIKGLNFKFQPDALQEAEFGNVKGYYENGDGFPLWLLLSMNGPVVVTPDRFGVNATQGCDTLWTAELTSVDSLNGFCQANFAIDPRTARAALTVTTPQESVTYIGSVLPLISTELRSYKNNKIAALAPETERTLDECISKKNFQVTLNSETYGRKAYVVVTPDKLAITRSSVMVNKYEVVCIEKVGDHWYVCIEIPSKNEFKEASVLNLIIDAKTGDTNYRFGPWNQLRKNWMDIVDGVTSVPQIPK